MTIIALQNTDAIDKLIECQIDGEEALLLHVVNCQGVMGSGIALQIKNRKPEAYEIYMESYEDQGLVLGSISIADGVVNMAAQFDYGRKNRNLNYGALSICLYSIKNIIDSIPEDVKIIVPYLMGCDRAGGDWEVVLEMVDFMFDDVIVCDINKGE